MNTKPALADNRQGVRYAIDKRCASSVVPAGEYANPRGSISTVSATSRSEATVYADRAEPTSDHRARCTIATAMRALTYTRYGPPDVVELSEVPRPEPRPGELLVRVRASAVNTADWRVRAAAFPGILAVPGRLMFGIRRPRNRRLGTEYAGVVETMGSDVTRFAKGDAVFGIHPAGGASAEFVAVPEDGAVAPMPRSLAFDEAAALPFGGLCALVFLTDYAAVASGDEVLIVGASGGVGAYAVQIAKGLGARVTGVAGPDSQQFMAELGADVVVDYSTRDVAALDGRYDVVLDTIGTLSPGAARGLLRTRGRFLPLNYGLREIGAALCNPLHDRKIRVAVNPDRQEDLSRLARLVEAGTVRPVIDRRYALEEARQAHAHVESRHRKGATILTLD